MLAEDTVTPTARGEDARLLRLTEQQPPLLASRLRFETLRPQLVSRPRLVDRLAGSSARLSVVAAPAGFGKSTLLAQWSAVDPRRFAYVELERWDNDPLSFWTCIVLAIRGVEPGFGADVEPLLRTVGGNAVEVLTHAISVEMERLDFPVVLVLDDYHVIHNRDCHASVEALVAHAGMVHVVLSTQFDRPIRLGRLRASGRLLELRGRDLAFTEDETDALVQAEAGLDLAPEQLRVLQARTEGWPAGVQLAALGLASAADRDAFLRSFGGSNRHVVDYLTEVVVSSLRPEVQDFLSKTSVLPRFTSELCDVVTGRDDSARILQEVARENLFVIPLDDRRRWYRYHHLFADLLNEELRARQSPEQIRDLHHRAYTWFAETGDVDQGIEQAIAAGELDQARELVLANWSGRLSAGRLTTITSWLAAFPECFIRESATLSIVKAWVGTLQGRRDEVAQALDEARAARPTGERMPDGNTDVESSVALIRAMTPSGDVAGLREAVAAIPHFRDRLEPEFRAAAAFASGRAAFLSGESREAMPHLQHAASLAVASQTWVTAMDSLGFQAQVALQESRPEEAERLARRTIETARVHGLVNLPHAGYYVATLGAAVARGGRLEEGDALLAAGIRQLGEWDLLVAAHARMLRVPVRRQLGDLEGAQDLLDEAKSLLAACVDPGFVGGLVPALERTLATSHRRGEDRRELTDRELDVLRLLARGLSKREIANELFLSFNTIHSHTRSIYTRLDASSRAEAVARARSLDLM